MPGAFGALAALFLHWALAGCGGGPEVADPGVLAAAPAPSAPAAQTPGSPAEAPSASREGKSRPSMLYNLAHTARPGTEEPASEAIPQAAPKGTGDGVPRAGKLEPPDRAGRNGPASLEGWSDAALVAELEARFIREWSSIQGGIGDAGSAPQDPRREEVARRLIALGFLYTEDDPPRGPLEEALAFARADSRSMELRLIAASFLESDGRAEESRGIVGAIAGKTRPAEATPLQGAPGAESLTFGVEGLSFARSIEGPGEYVPASAEELRTGKTILVYGEFKNFRSVLDARGEAPVHHRAFAASLRLLSASGQEMDSLDFLPEGHGHQASAAPGEIVNFWARYRIPANLKAGEYRLSIQARDLLAGAEATGEIPFELK